MSWLDFLTWPRAAISNIEADLAWVRVEIPARLKHLENLMAADRDLLATIAQGLTALASPVADLIASEAALRARVVELEGDAAADEAGDLAAAGAVKTAFDELAGKFADEPEVPDVAPLPDVDAPADPNV